MNELIKKYNIDISRLERNYFQFPLIKSRGRKKGELPNINDYRYLYLELNLSRRQLADVFQCSIETINRFNQIFKIKKDYNLRQNLLKQTCLSKYGFVNPMKNKEIIDKVSNTKSIRYNNQGYTNREKSKRTCLSKYGFDNPMKDFTIQEKAKQTNLKRYGGNSPMSSRYVQEKWNKNFYSRFKTYRYAQTQEFKDFIKIHKDEIQRKSYNTKKKNNTFNISKEEFIIFNSLLKKFPDTIHQYRDEERYPFNCDFYIPSKDLFIEYHGSWLHNNHPYNENDINDIQEVTMLKEKSKEINFKGHEKDLYQNAIYTWTDLDVRKRRIAKENNLNYLEFFNMKEFNDWLLNQ